jgi:hypothetical protein
MNNFSIRKLEYEADYWFYHIQQLLFFCYSNWGTEVDDSHYHNGNSEPRGFGKILWTWYMYLYFKVNPLYTDKAV